MYPEAATVYFDQLSANIETEAYAAFGHDNSAFERAEHVCARVLNLGSRHSCPSIHDGYMQHFSLLIVTGYQDYLAIERMLRRIFEQIGHC